MAVEKMIVAGRELQLETRDDFPIKDLKLDRENPRLHYITAQLGGHATDAKLHELLWSRDAVKELMTSIEQNGGLIEPLIVRRNGTVVEGNCRAVALRELLKRHPSKTQWRKARVRILPEVADKEQEAILLGDLHVAGKIPWDRYEQARYIAFLHHELGKDYDYISAHLRFTRNKISAYLAACRLTDEYLKKNPDPGNVKKFSLFEEALKKKEVKTRIESDLKFKGQLFDWISDGKLSAALQMRVLPDILKNADACEALTKKGYDAAYKVIVKDKPAMTSDLFAAIENATEQVKSAPLEEIQALKSGDVVKITMLRNLHRAIQDLSAVSNVHL